MKNIISLIVIVVMLAFIPYGAWQIWENYQEESLSSNPQRIFEETLQKAEAGDAGAQYQMGLKYHFGRNGLSRDPLEAMKWYEKAAKQGHVKAQYNLGYLYDDKKDLEKAVYWYKMAAEQGFMDAQYNLGWHYYKQEKYDESIIWLEKAAEQGYANANQYLGWHYYNRKEYEAALPWLLKASELGYADANRYLAFMYDQGLGVEPDFLKAGSLYKKAADLGSQLPNKYLEDTKKYCNREFKEVNEDHIEACLIRAGFGDPEAQYKAAIAYQLGAVVSKNSEISYELLRKAAAQGHNGAGHLLKSLEKQAAESPDGKVDWDDMTLWDLIDLRLMDSPSEK